MSTTAAATLYDARKAYEVRTEIASEILATLTAYLAGEDGGVEASHAVNPDIIHWGHVGSAREAVNHLGEAARYLLGDDVARQLLGYDVDAGFDQIVAVADGEAGVRGTRVGD